MGVRCVLVALRLHPQHIARYLVYEFPDNSSHLAGGHINGRRKIGARVCPAMSWEELCPNLGDDGLRRAAYRGG